MLVVGGGPAGATAARTLAKEGIDTLFADKNFSFVKPCGGGIPSAAFDELGIPHRLACRYVESVKIVSPNNDALDIKLRGGAIAIVERGVFDSALRRLAEEEGARPLQAEFRRFTDMGKTLSAELMLEGKSLKVIADYVIASDGVNSRVRTATGLNPVASFLTVSEKIKGENTDSCEFWFGASHAPRFYSWVFPQKDSISVGTGAFEPREIRILWQRFLEKRGLANAHKAVRGYKIPLWQGDLYNKDRIFYAGDAAGQVMPLSYEGIYYAMKSGEFAARAIISGKAGDYKKLWKKRFYKRFILMKQLWEYFLKDDMRAERLVQLHKRPEVQDSSMRLWLKKDLNRGSLLSYINLVRNFLA